MKEFWLEKNQCTGCAACVNVCPQSAIVMSEDKCGFNYPIINNKCIDCGLCEKICNERLENNNSRFAEPNVYASWSLDNTVRYNSTSGGLFSEIAKKVLQSGGVVCGAKYNSDNLVEHAIVEDEAGLKDIRQSKYIQSNINNIYSEVEKRLKQGKLVAFCGAPCQVAALYSYLRKEYGNLLTIDFICRGMNSPKAYKSWLDEIEDEEKSKAVRVWFKYKTNGWKRSPRCTRVDFENGKQRVYDQENNLFMCGYLGSNLYIRPSCANCDFKGIPRHSDITLADFWKIDEKLDDNKGTSLLMINSKRGREIFESILSQIFFEKMEISDILEGNVCFENSVEINPNSEKFLYSLDTMKFSKALFKYNKKIFIKRFVKRLLRKID